jgi:hypothetical protein
MKIDIEGAEEQLFTGENYNWWKKYGPMALCIEVYPKQQKFVFEKLSQLNYVHKSSTKAMEHIFQKTY